MLEIIGEIAKWLIIIISVFLGLKLLILLVIFAFVWLITR